MILKIATYGEDRKAQWRFIDDVGEVATMSVFLRKAKREDGKADVLRFFVAEDCENKWNPDMIFLPPSVEKAVFESGSVTRVSALLMMSRAKVGSLIAFHEAYLMNDEGKTIERL